MPSADRTITLMFGVVSILCGHLEAQTRQFEFAGLSPRTSMEDLKSRYPLSYFDGTSPDGTSVRVVPEEVHDHIYFIALNTQISSLRLSFERPVQYIQNLPADWAAEQRARHPLCAPILGQLIKAYGAPDAERPWSEEALEHLTRYWFTEHEQLRLDCYQPGGTGDFLALDIHICPRQAVVRPRTPCS